MNAIIHPVKQQFDYFINDNDYPEPVFLKKSDLYDRLKLYDILKHDIDPDIDPDKIFDAIPPRNSYAVFNHVFNILTKDKDFTSLVKVKEDAKFNTMYCKSDDSTNDDTWKNACPVFKSKLLNYSNNLSFLDNINRRNFTYDELIDNEWIIKENTGCAENWSDIKKQIAKNKDATQNEELKKKLTIHNMFDEKECGKYLELAPEVVEAVNNYEKNENKNKDTIIQLTEVPIYFILKVGNNNNAGHVTCYIYYKQQFYSFGIGGLGTHAVIFGIDVIGIDHLQYMPIIQCTLRDYLILYRYVGCSIVDMGILTSGHIKKMTELVKNVDQCLIDFCVSKLENNDEDLYNYTITNFQYVLKNDYNIICPIVDDTDDTDMSIPQSINCTNSINVIFKDTINCAGSSYGKTIESITTPSYWFYKNITKPITNVVTENLTIPGACRRRFINEDWSSVCEELIKELFKSKFSKLRKYNDEKFSESQPSTLDGTIFNFNNIINYIIL